MIGVLSREAVEEEERAFFAGLPSVPAPTPEQVARWPAGMDPGCIRLCEALRSISTVVTTYSCDGHTEGRFHIAIRTGNRGVYSRILDLLNSRRYAFGPRRQFHWEVLALAGAPAFRLDLRALIDPARAPFMAEDLIIEIAHAQAHGGLPKVNDARADRIIEHLATRTYHPNPEINAEIEAREVKVEVVDSYALAEPWKLLFMTTRDDVGPIEVKAAACLDGICVLVHWSQCEHRSGHPPVWMVTAWDDESGDVRTIEDFHEGEPIPPTPPFLMPIIGYAPIHADPSTGEVFVSTP